MFTTKDVINTFGTSRCVSKANYKLEEAIFKFGLILSVMSFLEELV